MARVSTLTTLKRAAARRRLAEVSYRKALLAAAAENTNGSIARALGVSTQAVGQMLTKLRKEQDR